MGQLLPAFTVCGRSHSFWNDPARRFATYDSFDLETIASQMSRTFAAVVKTFPIDLYFEFSLSIEMVDACSCGQGGSSFGHGSAVGN